VGGGNASPNEPQGAGTADEASVSGPSIDPAAASSCVDDINALRATIGLGPLTQWNGALGCADSEASTDSMTQRAHSAFPRCREFAQNECPGWMGDASTMIKPCLQAMWGEGPGGGHYDNMTNTSYTQVACGFSSDGTSTWSVQSFR
jgi:hypothetical protein